MSSSSIEELPYTCLLDDRCNRLFMKKLLSTPLPAIIVRKESLNNSRIDVIQHPKCQHVFLNRTQRVKGTSHVLFFSGKPINHFQKQGKIHLNQKKLQNPCKTAEITKKKVFF